jgi:hypothetical protein
MTRPGVVFVNGSIIHIASASLTALCGASNPYGQPNETTNPIGAVSLDDPHLCPQCLALATE